MANSDQHTERVVPDDGRRESSLVLLAVLLILLAGGFGLSVNQTVPASLPGHLLLDVGDKATLTALRNAGDEILFLQEEGEPLPDIQSLSEAGIPPFARLPGAPADHLWSKISEHCYQGEPLSGQGLEFMLTLNQGVAVFWRPVTESDSHDHSTQRTGICQPDHHWQEFTNA